MAIANLFLIWWKSTDIVPAACQSDGNAKHDDDQSQDSHFCPFSSSPAPGHKRVCKDNDRAWPQRMVFLFSNSELLFTLTFSSKSSVSRVPEEWGKMTR